MAVALGHKGLRITWLSRIASHEPDGQGLVGLVPIALESKVATSGLRLGWRTGAERASCHLVHLLGQISLHFPDTELWHKQKGFFLFLGDQGEDVFPKCDSTLY